MSDLHTETLRLAREIDAPVDEICKRAKVKPRWYYKFTAGEFTDPGVNKVSRLNKALKSMARNQKVTPRAAA